MVAAYAMRSSILNTKSRRFGEPIAQQYFALAEAEMNPGLSTRPLSQPDCHGVTENICTAPIGLARPNGIYVIDGCNSAVPAIADIRGTEHHAPLD
jgi:hypothetical protein